jgi:hypothetical protein
MIIAVHPFFNLNRREQIKKATTFQTMINRTPIDSRPEEGSLREEKVPTIKMRQGAERAQSHASRKKISQKIMPSWLKESMKCLRKKDGPKKRPSNSSKTLQNLSKRWSM